MADQKMFITNISDISTPLQNINSKLESIDSQLSAIKVIFQSFSFPDMPVLSGVENNLITISGSINTTNARLSDVADMLHSVSQNPSVAVVAADVV